MKKLNKKGVYLTATFLFIGWILLSLSFMVSNEENEVKQGADKMIMAERLYGKHMQISTAVQKLLNTVANISAEKTNYTVTINEKINSNGFTNYLAEIAFLETFLTQYGEPIQLKEGIKNELKFAVDPLEINYTPSRNTQTITIDLNDKINLAEILMSIYKKINETIWVEYQAGSFLLKVTVVHSNGEEIEAKNIDPNGQSELRITTDDGKKITIRITGNKLYIISETYAEVSTTMQFTERISSLTINDGLFIDYGDIVFDGGVRFI